MFLRSNRIGFRWWSADDYQLARELWGDPAVTRFFSKEPFTDEQVQERLNLEIDRAAKFKMQYWPIFKLATNLHIGCAGLRPYREDIFELGVHVRELFWGKGYATEAGRALIEHSKTMGARALFAGHHPDNLASKNVLLKLGFEETGTEFYEPTGLLHPSYLLQID